MCDIEVDIFQIFMFDIVKVCKGLRQFIQIYATLETSYRYFFIVFLSVLYTSTLKRPKTELLHFTPSPTVSEIMANEKKCSKFYLF